MPYYKCYSLFVSNSQSKYHYEIGNYALKKANNIKGMKKGILYKYILR